MKYVRLSVILLILLFSCRHIEKFPEYVTLPLSEENMELEAGFSRLSAHACSGAVNHATDYTLLDSLLVYKGWYLQHNESFQFERFQNLWEEFGQQAEKARLTEDAALKWFEATAFIFELTGNALMAEELEKIAALHLSALGPELFDSIVAPYVITKNVDHIWVNLFLPTTVNYTHSLGGDVTAVLHSEFPESGSIRLNFDTEIKRYIEVYVRIPSWAKNTSVTVKKVKYFTQPGNYCLIAKKWKSGDVVEIEIPLENLPDYLKSNI